MLSLLRFFYCLLLYTLPAMFVFACQTTQSTQATRSTIVPPAMIFSMASLNKDEDSLNALMQNIMKGEEAIIKIDKDYIFPLIFDLESNAAVVDPNNNTIELSFNQDIYLSISKKAAKLSRNARNWMEITDIAALKKIFYFSKGTLTFSISANEGDPAAIVMAIGTK